MSLNDHQTAENWSSPFPISPCERRGLLHPRSGAWPELTAMFNDTQELLPCKRWWDKRGCTDATTLTGCPGTGGTLDGGTHVPDGVQSQTPPFTSWPRRPCEGGVPPVGSEDEPDMSRALSYWRRTVQKLWGQLIRRFWGSADSRSPVEPLASPARSRYQINFSRGFVTLVYSPKHNQEEQKLLVLDTRGRSKAARHQ